MTKIAFIGGGNMAVAIISGLIADGTVPQHIIVSDPDPDTRVRLATSLAIRTTETLSDAVADADTVVLAVKPQIVPAVAAEIVSQVDLSNKLLISVAAGIPVSRLTQLFGDIAVVRTMPNTPALVGKGATGIFLSDQVTTDQRAQALAIVTAFGICVEVDSETLLDAVTALSGSGPAYVFLMIEAMTDAGVALGLSRTEASLLARQTTLGAATMAATGDVPVNDLRRRVTSPNGTTHAAITQFQSDGFAEMVARAMTACRDRAVELGSAEATG